MYKINYDAAIFEHEGKSGIGVIIRDSHGAAIATLSQLIPCAYQAADMEAIATNRALEFAREIGINEAILEGNSSLVHQALKRGEHSLSPFGLLVEDIKRGEHSLSPFGLLVEDIKLFSASFSTLLYSHTKREGNKVAHGLVRHAIHILDYVVWMESMPPLSYAVFQADLANIVQ